MIKKMQKGGLSKFMRGFQGKFGSGFPPNFPL
jgi:hypothetical protein